MKFCCHDLFLPNSHLDFNLVRIPNNTLVQMIETDKLHVKELRQQGYSDNQLRELGFPAVALGQAPAVLKSS